MNIFKNKVGRPSNDIKKKRKLIVFSVITFFVLFIFIVFSKNDILVINNNNDKKVYLREKTKQEKETEEYVKDFKASDGFYDKYFEDYEVMQNMNNLDNVLIVITKENIENTFGATFIVEAPDYAYFLQYNNEDDRNKAYDEFTKLKESGKIYSVDINTKAVFMDNSNIQSISFNSNWYKKAMGFDSAKDYIINNPMSENVSVAFLDKYPAENSNFNNVYNKYFDKSRIINNNYVVGHSSYEDHGIMVSSITDSVLPSIFSFEQYDDTYNTSFSVAMDKLSTTSGVHVVNLSFICGIGNNPAPFYSNDYNTIQRALERGVITVASAGNFLNSKDYYPAAYSNVISVSGIDSNYFHIFSSSDSVDFVAPAMGLYCISIDSGVKTNCAGTSFSSPLVASTVAMLKYYDPEISLENVKTLLSLYARKNIAGFKLGKDGFGNGLVYVGDTKIFEDVKNKDYTSGPVMKEKMSFFERLKNMFYSCSNSSVEEFNENKVTTKEEKPNTLTEVSGNYLITNYKKVEKMKKQKDYACDGKSDCYANAYYMKLVGKVPVSYYANCSAGTEGKVTSGSCSVSGKIKYLCSSSCPNAKVTTGNLANAYLNVVSKNKPSILKIKNGNVTHTVVIVGITKAAYRKYKNSANNDVSIKDFVVLDVWDGKIKEVNNYDSKERPYNAIKGITNNEWNEKEFEVKY